MLDIMKFPERCSKIKGTNMSNTSWKYHYSMLYGRFERGLEAFETGTSVLQIHVSVMQNDLVGLQCSQVDKRFALEDVP